MNTNKEMSIAVIFLAAAIIFVSSTPMAKNAFAQTIGEEEEDQVSNTGTQNYENFLTCLSDAGGQNSYPAGNQIVNCLVESGYEQGSSSTSTSNTEDSKDQNENAQTSVVDDQSDDQGNEDDQSDGDQSDGDQSDGDQSDGDQSEDQGNEDDNDQSDEDDQSHDEE
jgi:hypothetical protein